MQTPHPTTTTTTERVPGNWIWDVSFPTDLPLSCPQDWDPGASWSSLLWLSLGDKVARLSQGRGLDRMECPTVDPCQGSSSSRPHVPGTVMLLFSPGYSLMQTLEVGLDLAKLCGLGSSTSLV